MTSRVIPCIALREWLAVLLVIAPNLPSAADAPPPIAGIVVNTTADGLNDGDGMCSLREAIEAANTDTAVDACMAGSGHDYITLPPCTRRTTA